MIEFAANAELCQPKTKTANILNIAESNPTRLRLSATASFLINSLFMKDLSELYLELKLAANLSC